MRTFWYGACNIRSDMHACRFFKMQIRTFGCAEEMGVSVLDLLLVLSLFNRVFAMLLLLSPDFWLDPFFLCNRLPDMSKNNKKVKDPKSITIPYC